MFKKSVCALLILSGITVCLAGCGSENSGSISMAAPSYSNGIATAKATYSPSEGPALANQEITFFWRTVGKTSGNTDNYPPEVSHTDTTGTALSVLTLPSPRTEALIVYVRAGTGDLTTGLQSVDAP